MTCVDWSAVAPAWAAQSADVERMKEELCEYQLSWLGDLAGAQVLELGSGTGEFAVRLAGLVGSTGRVVASDAAVGMVDLERRRLAEVAGAEVQQIDACEIPFPDASFDVAVFRMGLMLVPDPDVALQQIRRVLRPGGRAALAVWGAPQDNPWLTALGMAAMMHGLVTGGPPTDPGGPFSLAEPDDLEKRLRNAGFSQVEVTPIESTRHFAGVEEHFEMVQALAPPLADALRAASGDEQADVRATFAGLVRPYADDAGLHLPVRALSCLARA